MLYKYIIVLAILQAQETAYSKLENSLDKKTPLFEKEGSSVAFAQFTGRLSCDPLEDIIEGANVIIAALCGDV